MVLKYKIQTVTSVEEDEDEAWFLLREIDELEDETIVAESHYRNELQRLKNYLDKEQRQLTAGDYD
jgi:hypothetical protein